jgi:hypothetical protein
VAALLAASLPSMVWMDLSENPIGDDAARAFVDADLPALRRLDLGYPHNGQAITDRGAHHLAQAKLPRLTNLGVEFHAIAGAGATALAARQGLRLLRICHGNRMTAAAGDAVVRAVGVTGGLRRTGRPSRPRTRTAVAATDPTADLLIADWLGPRPPPIPWWIQSFSLSAGRGHANRRRVDRIEHRDP